MANGNMGDLSLTLSVEDRVSKSLRDIQNAFTTLDTRVSSTLGNLNDYTDSYRRNADLIASVLKGLGGSTREQIAATTKLDEAIKSMSQNLSKLDVAKKKAKGNGDTTIRKELSNEETQVLKLISAYGMLKTAIRDAEAGRKSTYELPTFNKGGIEDIQKAWGQAFDNIGLKAERLKETIDKTLNAYAGKESAMMERLRKISPSLDGKDWQGKALSARDMAQYVSLQNELNQMSEKHQGILAGLQKEYDGLTQKMQNLVRLSEQASSQQAQAFYKPYTGQTATDEAAMARRRDDVRKTYEEYFAAEKKKREEEEKTRREQQQTQRAQEEAAQRARANIDKIQSRYEQLFDTMRKMRSARNDASVLGLDTAKIDAQIQGVIQSLKKLRSWRDNAAGALSRGTDMRSYIISNKDFSVDRSMGGVVSTRDVELLNRQTAEQQKLNNEKRASIEAERKHQQEVAATANKVRGELVAAFEQARRSASGMNTTLQDMKSLFLQGGIVYGAKQFFDAVVQTGGEIEKQHIALRSILGDRAKADELFQQTQQLALQSPFKFGELNKDVKQLAAFGVEANDLYDTTKRLADIASGLGVDFSRLGLAYGQVKARSWLDGKELRQFAYAGLPLLKSITDLYNQTGKGGRNDYTEGDVKKMISNREVSFEDVQKVLWNMTDEGGKFYNMQFVLSETLLGKWNKLIDAWEIMLSKFADGGSVIGGVFKAGITGATNLILVLDKLSPALLAFGAAFALKKGWGALTAVTGLSSVTAQMKTAQATAMRTYAVKQQEMLIEGKISAEKMRQNILDRQGLMNSQLNKRNMMESLALQGRLSMLQMQRAFREKLISPELIKQLQLMGMISAKEAQLITQSGIWARMQLAGLQVWKGMSGLFTWGNAAMLGFTAIAGIIAKISADQEKIEQRTKDIRESARDHSQSMADALRESGNTDTSDPQKLQQTNDALKDVLEQSGNYTDTIREQVEEAGTLIEQYKILKKAVEDAKGSADTEDAYANVISEAIAKSGNLFNDDITKNVNDLEERFNKLSVKIDGFDAKTRAKMESVANSILGPTASAMTLEEKIIALGEKGGDAYRTFVKEVSNGNKEMSNRLSSIGLEVNLLIREIDQIANDDIPKIISTISSALGISENDFRKWASKNVTTFDTMFTKILSLCNIKVPAIVKKIREIMYESLKLQDPQKPKDTANKPKTWKNPLKAGGVGRKTFDKLYDAGKLSGGANGFWQKEMADLINTIGGSGGSSWHDFGESLQKMYKDIRNENNSAKKAGEKQPYFRKQKMLEAVANQIGVSLDVGKDRVTGDFGKDKNKNNKKDTVLDALKERISLYKTYYSELQKFRKTYGAGAEARLQEQDDFKPIKGYNLSNSSNYRQSVTELTSRVKKNTPERRAYIDKAIADISSKDRDLEEKSIGDINSELREKLNLLSEEYSTYKKLYELTGDQRGSMQLAFGEQVESPTVKGALRKNMEDVLPEANKRSGQSYTADEVLGMSEADFKAAYGEDSKEISEIYKQWREETKKLKQETITLMQEIIEKNRTTTQQIEDRKRQHTQDLQRIDESDTSPEMKQRAKEGEDKTFRDDMSKLELQRFKEQQDWVVIFDDLNNVGNRTISSLIANIDKFSKDTTLSVAEVKELRDALQKLKDEQVDRNPFIGMLSSGAEAASIGHFMRTNTPGADGKYTVSDKQAKKMGIKAGSYSKAELDTQKGEKQNGLSKSLSSLQKKFSALSSSLDPVVSLMDALGSEDTTLSNILQGGDNALGAAANTASGISAITDTMQDGALKDALGSAGPYGAAASAAISIIGSFAAAHDAALQKEIEASKQRQKEMENLSKNVQTMVDNILGGVYSYEMDAKTRQKLQEVTEIYDKEITERYFKDGKFYSTKDGKSRYSRDTNTAVAKSLANPNSAFDAQYASLMVQRDELQKQRDSENKKKKKDKDAISDYDQQITEMEQEIQNFTNEWMKSIYDIDLKDWASQLTEAIVDAWSKGEDAVDAYKDKVQEMMNSLTKNILSQSIMETMLKPTLDKLSKKLQDNGGKLAADDVIDVTNSLVDAEDNAITSITQILEQLKNKGLDLSENGSLSTSNSIKSITEETADLLASYINAIRLDVSVNRENVRIIAEAVKCLPNMNAVAESQLISLNNLVSLAEKRNEKLDMMYDWMRATTNGTKKISVA